MAGAALMEISRNEDERTRYLSRKKAENDRISEMLTHEEIGRRASARDMAREMKADNAPIETIARYTKLSIAEIDTL